MQNLTLLLGGTKIAQMTLAQPRGLPLRAKKFIYRHLVSDRPYVDYTVASVDTLSPGNAVDVGKLTDALRRIVVRKFEDEEKFRILHTAPLRDVLWQDVEISFSIKNGRVVTNVPEIVLEGDGIFLIRYSCSAKVELNQHATSGPDAIFGEE